jgi:PAS domain S-box-containing protein
MNALLPHGICLLWQPHLMWLHVLSDSLIAFCYFAIPLAMVVLMRQRQDMKYRQLYTLFALFVGLCGLTHLVSIWTLWHPDYVLQGLLKAVTAFVSILTLIMLVRLMPTLFKMPSVQAYEAKNLALQAAVDALEASERQLQQKLAELEAKQRIEQAKQSNLHLTQVLSDGLQAVDGPVYSGERLAVQLINGINQHALVSITDQRGKIVYVNDTMCQVTGYSAEELIGRNHYLLNSGFHDKAFWQAMYDTINAGQVFKGLIRNRHKDGSIRWLETTITPLLDANGAPYEFVSMRTDITDSLAERDELRAQLVQSTKLETFGQLTAGVSHEFNNVLACIMGYTDLARDELQQKNTASLDDYLAQIDLAGQRARDLIRKMMDYVRHQRPSDSAPDGLDPLPLIKDAVELVRASLPALISINTELQPVAAIALSATDITQLITNLAINARDAIVESGTDIGSITIGLRNTHFGEYVVCSDCGRPLASHANSAYVELYVSDSGVGMANDHIEKIFAPFYTTKEVGKGTGLGLSVISGIVHGAGGHIVVKSEPAKGSQFQLLLPPVQEEALVFSDLSSRAMPITTATPGLRLLVVDDEPMLIGLMKARLTQLGHRPEVFLSPFEALTAFTREPETYDAVITDFNMPLMDGLNFAKTLQIARPHTRVIICSGQIIDTALLPDNVFYTPKPIDYSDLLNKAAGKG